MKRRLTFFLSCIVMVMIILSSFVPLAFAETQTQEPPAAQSAGEGDIVPFGEVIERVYKYYADGRVACRIWSVTRGIWLTDWFFVN